MKVINEYKDSYDVNRALVLWHIDEIDKIISSSNKLAGIIMNHLSRDMVDRMDKFTIDIATVHNLAAPFSSLLFSKLMKYYHDMMMFVRKVKSSSVEWVDLTEFDTRFDDITSFDSSMKSVLKIEDVEDFYSSMSNLDILLKWIEKAASMSGLKTDLHLEDVAVIYNALGLSFRDEQIPYDYMIQIVISVLTDKTIETEDDDE